MGLISFLKNKFSKSKDDESMSYKKGLDKSRKDFSNKISSLSTKYKKVNEEYFNDLEEILLEADVGVNLAISTIEQLLSQSMKEHITDVDKLNNCLIDILFENYCRNYSAITDIEFAENKPNVLLMAGVNGVGKTTTIAKLANRYLMQNKTVMLAAADTFRAGAVEQLALWADKLNIKMIKGKDNADPASVVYDSVKQAKQDNVDLLIIDTAGRLQNKENLMLELGKIKRVIYKEISESNVDTFLVLDATTGQNGISQAKAFKEVTDITGIVITKMDGTSKGGIILPIKNDLNIPVRFIGLGEGIDDLKPFDLEKYLYALCIGDDINGQD